METTITKTVVRTTERVTTENAVYDVESVKSNGTVTTVTGKVTAQITATDGDGNPITQAQLQGTIVYNNGTVHTDNMLASDMLPTYIGEFLEIVAMVKSRE